MKIFSREGLSNLLVMGSRLSSPISRTNYPLISSSFGTPAKTPQVAEIARDLSDDEVMTLISNFQSFLLQLFVNDSQRYGFDKKWLATSGYRNGGSPTSAHRVGVAIDFSHPTLVSGRDQRDLFKTRRDLLFKMCELYRTTKFPADQILFGKGHIHVGWSRIPDVSFQKHHDFLILQGLSRNCHYGYEASLGYDGQYSLIMPNSDKRAWRFVTRLNGLYDANYKKQALEKWDKMHSYETLKK